MIASTEALFGRERLAGNILHFARVLRAAGLPIGPAKVIVALNAVEAVGVGNRDDFRAALEAVLIERHEHKVLFDQAFDLFWRNPKMLERMMALLLPKVRGRVTADQAEAPLPARLAEALAERLLAHAPFIGPAKAAFFNAGTEAVENAVKFARAYTKRPAVIAFEGAFHGRTLLSLTLTSKTHPY